MVKFGHFRNIYLASSTTFLIVVREMEYVERTGYYTFLPISK